MEGVLTRVERRVWARLSRVWRSVTLVELAVHGRKQSDGAIDASATRWFDARELCGRK